MNKLRGHIHGLLLLLVGLLLKLYPPRFRREFSSEIQEIVLSRMNEAERHGEWAFLVTAFQEIVELSISILYENWHELRLREEKAMLPEDPLPKNGGGTAVLRFSEGPGWLWFPGWVLLTTIAIPAAFIMRVPLAALFIWLINLSGGTGIWSAAASAVGELTSFVISLALAIGLLQWVFLRRFLPGARLWPAVTGAGILLGGLAIWLFWGITPGLGLNPIRYLVALLLPMGLSLGLAQWLYLRHFLLNAFWIIIIDVLAVASLGLTIVVGQLPFGFILVPFFFPGAITGLGLWLLLRQSNTKIPHQMSLEASGGKSRNIPRLAWTGLGLVAMIPLFFICIWIYTVSQLTLAKNEGVYLTVEEAVIVDNSQGFGGAQVVRIENVHAGPNSFDGSHPHVWFGGATVYMDRAPEGYNWDHYPAGSYYIHVKEGWVHIPEGAFPEFIGWVMELYHMEGVGDTP